MSRYSGQNIYICKARGTLTYIFFRTAKLATREHGRFLINSNIFQHHTHSSRWSVMNPRSLSDKGDFILCSHSASWTNHFCPSHSPMGHISIVWGLFFGSLYFRNENHVAWTNTASQGCRIDGNYLCLDDTAGDNAQAGVCLRFQSIGTRERKDLI